MGAEMILGVEMQMHQHSPERLAWGNEPATDIHFRFLERNGSGISRKVLCVCEGTYKADTVFPFPTQISLDSRLSRRQDCCANRFCYLNSQNTYMT